METPVNLDSSIPTTTTAQSSANRENYCLKHIYSNPNEYNISYCPIKPLETEINKIVINNNENNIISNMPFLPSASDVRLGGRLGLSLNGYAYKKDIDYWLGGYAHVYNYNNGQYQNIYFHYLARSLNKEGVDFDLKDFDA